MGINEKLKGYVLDPAYQKEHDQNAVVVAERIKKVREIEAEFISAWQTVDFLEIESISDIMDFKKSLKAEQTAFILRWLLKMSNEVGSQESLVRGLILSGAPFEGQVLKNLFDDPESSFHLKWAIGNTIASTKALNVTEWLKNKVDTLPHGKEKEMLMYALPKYFDLGDAIAYLGKLFDHYPLHTADALAKVGDSNDLTFILEKLVSYKGPGRASINKSVKKLEKRLQKPQPRNRVHA